MSIAVSVADKISDTVKLYHTPSVPINKGRIYRQGRRKISCLLSERNIDFLTTPILWKPDFLYFPPLFRPGRKAGAFCSLSVYLTSIFHHDILYWYYNALFLHIKEIFYHE